MSVINQMLQELEQRRADGGTSAAQVRAVAVRQRKSMPWVALALIVATIVAALAYWFPPRVEVKKPVLMPASVPAVSPPAVVPPPQTEVTPQVLQLAGELGRLPPSLPSPQPRTEKKIPDMSAAEKLPEPPLPSPKPAPVVASGRPAAISKDIKQISSQQRAENAYRLAYDSLQQGRMSEAEDSLRQALQFDPRHAAARQALAALLVETKQLGRAEQLLQQGLDLQPGNTAYAMTLARLQVERRDLATALATLQHNPPAGEDAEYHGFLAALLQRGERHKEAIEQFQIALRSNPNAGTWLLGLGISMQADNQPAKAEEAFRRAKSSTTLSPELQAFADQRLKQLQ